MKRPIPASGTNLKALCSLDILQFWPVAKTVGSLEKSACSISVPLLKCWKAVLPAISARATA
jgi:hypothetical protein